MKILVVGMGKMGFALAEQLVNEEHDVTVVDVDREKIDKALETLDVGHVLGSGSYRATLAEAGVGEMDLVLAVTGSDEVNLLCCLLAKRLGAGGTVARVRDPEYFDELRLIKDDLGLSMSVNPERETAFEIARILGFPFAKNVETFANGRVEMINFLIDEHNPMCGRSVQSIFAPLRTHALVCAVERGDEVVIPFGDFVFRAGDGVTMVAPTENAPVFLRELGIKMTGIKDVIIVGGGRTALYLAKRLEKQKIAVKIVEKDRDKAFELSELLDSATIVLGDGTNHSLLLEEGIASADAVCCLTGIDEENILLSIYAASVSKSIKTITKINSRELMAIVAPLGIDSVVAPMQIAANRVLQYVRAAQNSVGSNVLTLYRILGGRAEALEFRVGADSELCGIPLEKLSFKKGVIIAGINRQGRIIAPRGGDTLEAGDTVIVVTTNMGLKELDDIRG